MTTGRRENFESVAVGLLSCILRRMCKGAIEETEKSALDAAVAFVRAPQRMGKVESIRSFMTQNRISQTEIAKMAGLSQPTVSRILKRNGVSGGGIERVLLCIKQAQDSAEPKEMNP